MYTTNCSTDTAYKVVYDIYSSVILRDTVQRYKIRDVELLERVLKYVFDNIGNTITREFEPLIAIKDHYPKYVVSMDELWKESVAGVKHVHIADFLLVADCAL